jgi:hypothetical protein
MAIMISDDEKKLYLKLNDWVIRKEKFIGGTQLVYWWPVRKEYYSKAGMGTIILNDAFNWQMKEERRWA